MNRVRKEKKGGVNFFSAHDNVKEFPPSLTLAQFLQAVACSFLHNAWVKAEGV